MAKTKKPTSEIVYVVAEDIEGQLAEDVFGGAVCFDKKSAISYVEDSLEDDDDYENPAIYEVSIRKVATSETSKKFKVKLIEPI